MPPRSTYMSYLLQIWKMVAYEHGLYGSFVNSTSAIQYKLNSNVYDYRIMYRSATYIISSSHVLHNYDFHAQTTFTWL